MLRYRLSLPASEGGKAKRRVGLGGRENTDSFAFGGPLQSAIRSDLDHLFPQFAALLRGPGEKDPVFDLFKSFFEKHKIALLHHLAPPRSDLAAYSQLLYAVCLSMIRSAFMDYQHMSAAFFEHVAYATFLLYTLYQTNPLPSPPNEDSLKGQLELLPFDLFDPRNPKESIFARHYRAPIRINLDHHGYLVRLLDLGKAAIDRQGGPCPPSLLRDLLSIVQRMIFSQMLEFCAYTGPCSLEGLAGHELYVDSDHRTKQVVTASPATTSGANSILASACKHQIQRYQACLKDIRLPAVSANMSNQSKRIRDSLEPVFSTDSTFDSLLKLANGERMKTLKHRHVSFGAVTVKSLEDSLSVDVPEVLLPQGTSADKADSIRLAILTLTQRGESLFLPSREYAAGVSNGFGSSVSAFTSSVTARSSTLEEWSNAGRQALRLLLEQAKHSTSFLVDQPLRNIEESSENPEGIIENLSDAFDALSDLSSDEEQDEVSTAISRVGQSALHDLLKAASARQSQKKNPTAAALMKNPKKKRQRPRNRTAKEPESKVFRSKLPDIALSSDEEQDEGSKSLSRVGKSALQHLLKAASAALPSKTKRSAAAPISVPKKKRQRRQIHTTTEPETAGQHGELLDMAKATGERHTSEAFGNNNSTCVESVTGQSKETTDASVRSDIGGNALRRLLEQARGLQPKNYNETKISDCVATTNAVVNAPAPKRLRPDESAGRFAVTAPLSEDETSKSTVHGDNGSIRSDLGRNMLQGLLGQIKDNDPKAT